MGFKPPETPRNRENSNLIFFLKMYYKNKFKLYKRVKPELALECTDSNINLDTTTILSSAIAIKM